MGIRHFDRSGDPMTATEWIRGSGLDNALVGSEEVTDPNGREHLVSTVWLGLDHGSGQGPPLIFETMVFCHDHECGWDDWLDRYSTEEQAIEGHAAVAKAVKRGEGPLMVSSDPILVNGVELEERLRRIEEALDYLCWRVGDISIREDIARILEGSSTSGRPSRFKMTSG